MKKIKAIIKRYKTRFILSLIASLIGRVIFSFIQKIIFP